MYRKTYAEIDLDVLTNNAKEITTKYSDYRYHIGVVKASAYGHGMHAVNALIRGGINYLATATLEEALAVRNENDTVPILVLEPILTHLNPEFLSVVTQKNITLTVDSAEEAKFLSGYKCPSPLKVHLKIDCGMNRLGLKSAEEVFDAVKLLSESSNVILEGIFTHLGTSGILDAHYDRAIKAFLELTRKIDLSKIPIVHINRSITLVHHKKYDFETGTRHGIILYGFSQSLPEPTGLRKWKRELSLKRLGISRAILTNELKLQTAFSLFSRVISVREVKKGEAVGYGAAYIAEKDQRIATVSIGYHDGIDEKLGKVAIGGKLFPIVGQICMDMISVRVDEGVKVGDAVEVFGKTISVSSAARAVGINSYRLLTGIGARVPRIYRKDGQTEEKTRSFYELQGSYHRQ